MKNNYNEDACQNLVLALYKTCLEKTTNINVVKERIEYVKNSPLISLLCITKNVNKKTMEDVVVYRNIGFIKNNDL